MAGKLPAINKPLAWKARQLRSRDGIIKCVRLGKFAWVVRVTYHSTKLYHVLGGGATAQPCFFLRGRAKIGSTSR